MSCSLVKAVLLAFAVEAFVLSPASESSSSRRRVVVEGGRAATPLGRVSTPAGKRARVDQLSSAIDDATLIFAFKGDGLNVKVMDDLRTRLPETATASVAKNTLFKRAGLQSGWSQETVDAPIFKGVNFWVFSGEDLKGTMDAYNDWIKEHGLKEGGYEIRGGVLEGAAVDDKGVKAAIDLPSKPELMARLAAAINLAGPLGIAKGIKNAKGNPQGLAVRLKKAAGSNLAVVIKLSVGDEEKNPN